MSQVAKQNPLLKSLTQFLKVDRQGFIYRYGLGIFLVILPLLLTLLVRQTGLTLNPTWPILICLLLTSWYAGRGPCLLAAFLFALALNVFFTRPPLTIKVNMNEVNRLAILLILAWIASARSRAEDRLRRRARQQETVARLAERALIERDEQALFKLGVELVAQTLKIEYCVVWESLPGEKRLLARAGVGWRTGTVGTAIIEADSQTLAGRVLLTEAPVIVKDLRKETDLRLAAILQEHEIVSGLGVPIPRKNGVVGVLAAYSRRKQVFSQDDVSFVQGCAFILAEASERLKIEREREELLVREQQARNAAEEASRLKDEFLTTVSHELRTPLNGILGWVSLLRQGRMTPEDSAQALVTIERNARIQTQIVSDILDVSRIITGRLRLDFQLVELANVVVAAVESMRPTAAAKGVKLEVRLFTVEANINGDATRLQQVVWNLLSNAIKFTPQGSSVQVALSKSDTHYEIQVKDLGAGIQPEFLPFVFDRFRQADSSSSRRYGGLGLGLAIVRHLVELHGGTVAAESEGVDKGATFNVNLPIPVPAEAGQEVRPAVPAVETWESLTTSAMKVDLTGLSVLVVDDDPDARALVTTVLEQSGARVKTAASAAEALDLMNLRRPDVIVSDISMPEEDGFTFIRQVRAMGSERGGNTPAAALSALTRSEDRLRAIQAGFQEHLAKPVHPAELQLVVASLAKRAGKLSELPRLSAN